MSSCPSCGRQPNRFVNGFLSCEGGHEWQGRIVHATGLGGQEDQSGAGNGHALTVPITIRGVEYNLTPNDNKHFMLLLCLVALNNPEIDNVLKAFGVVLDVGGKRVFP